MKGMTWLSSIFRRSPARISMTQFTPIPEGGYLVGGALRDALLERPFTDIDWLVMDPERAARAAADTLKGSVFPLDEARGHWRVVAGDVVRDFIRLEDSLETDLRARDFSVNALAADAGGNLFDPLGGRRDLERRVLRMVARENLFKDPLRPLRGVRLAVALGFRVEADTLAAVKAHAAAQLAGAEPLPAPERVSEELGKMLMMPGAARAVELLGEVRLLDVYLPELARARGVGQGGFHHLDVLEHSTEALRQLLLGFPEADLALRWATLLHDVGKPDTKTFDESGRYYHFYGHDRLGAELTQTLLMRLRQPSRLVERSSALVRRHMLPLPKSAREARRFVHRRRELLPDLLKLMIADREAARGPMSSEASRRGYRMALSRVLAIMNEPPPKAPLLDGRAVMELLELPPGPRIGEAVRFLREAEAVGDVSTEEEAVRALKHYAERQRWDRGRLES